MPGAEFAVARERLGWSVEETAAAYRVTPGLVERWERGTLRIPSEVGDDLAYRAAAAAREAAEATCPLPTCPEAEALERQLVLAQGRGDASPAATMEALDALRRHVDGCARCFARRAWVDRHAPPLPTGFVREAPRLPLFRSLLAGVALAGGVRTIVTLWGAGDPSGRDLLVIGAIAVLTIAMMALLLVPGLFTRRRDVD